MIQYVATAVSLVGVTLLRQEIGPWILCLGSILWVCYGLESGQWGLAATELVFVVSYYRHARATLP